MAHDDYLTPEQTETVLSRAAAISDGMSLGIPLCEIIKEFESVPGRKEKLDAARARLRARLDAGEQVFEIRDLVLTERGLKSVPATGAGEVGNV